jgi:hypothetical protein
MGTPRADCRDAPGSPEAVAAAAIAKKIVTGCRMELNLLLR